MPLKGRPVPAPLKGPGDAPGLARGFKGRGGDAPGSPRGPAGARASGGGGASFKRKSSRGRLSLSDSPAAQSRWSRSWKSSKKPRVPPTLAAQLSAFASRYGLRCSGATFSPGRSIRPGLDVLLSYPPHWTFGHYYILRVIQYTGTYHTRVSLEKHAPVLPYYVSKHILYILCCSRWAALPWPRRLVRRRCPR